MVTDEEAKTYLKVLIDEEDVGFGKEDKGLGDYDEDESLCAFNSTENIVLQRAIPSDNSCLFNAVGYVMEHDKQKASELRQVILYSLYFVVPGAPHKLSDRLLTFEQQKEKRDLANAKRCQAYANKQREKQKQISSNQVLPMQQCTKRKVNSAISAIVNPIDTNVILESDQSATTVNPSAIVFANTADNAFIKKFKEITKLPDLVNRKLVLKQCPKGAQQYILPTSDEVARIIVDSDEDNVGRNIVINFNTEGYQFINETYGLYDPL
ncbi:hypothetical protein GIB67_003944 [Kingdonia uniflora]|uniref:Uncharacterized protein n=1 Tax=Kingdonia uniflora TaxID=39325 RepID=A0A7J7LWZ7_9MAGN|nr:hypothetical protein GIB67_003944 [Kingdonia uniflora]